MIHSYKQLLYCSSMKWWKLMQCFLFYMDVSMNVTKIGHFYIFYKNGWHFIISKYLDKSLKTQVKIFLRYLENIFICKMGHFERNYNCSKCGQKMWRICLNLCEGNSSIAFYFPPLVNFDPKMWTLIEFRL